jgi:hypothetical protein
VPVNQNFVLYLGLTYLGPKCFAKVSKYSITPLNGLGLMVMLVGAVKRVNPSIMVESRFSEVKGCNHHTLGDIKSQSYSITLANEISLHISLGSWTS